MTYPADLRGWGKGWPRDRSSEMAAARTLHGQTVMVHREIQPIVQHLFHEIERRGYLIHRPGQIKDDWGYANRPVRGRQNPSNHSWGLAFDIDATQYPMGTRSNPPRWIIDLIESYGFEWGGRWKRPDPMHFEFAGSLTEARFLVSSLAAGHLQGKPAPSPATVPPPTPSPVPAAEEDDMYLRSDPKQGGKGEVYAMDAHHYEHLTPAKWKSRQEEGAKAWDTHPLTILHRQSSRRKLA